MSSKSEFKKAVKLYSKKSPKKKKVIKKEPIEKVKKVNQEFLRSNFLFENNLDYDFEHQVKVKCIKDLYLRIFGLDVINFPKVVYESKNLPFGLEEFLMYVFGNSKFHYRLGLENVSVSGSFPEIKAKIRDYHEVIYIHPEYYAYDYVKNGLPFGSCHLIISFVRNENQHMVKGIPVWSMYKRIEETNEYKFCLMEDIMRNFTIISTESNGLTKQYIDDVYNSYKSIKSELS